MTSNRNVAIAAVRALMRFCAHKRGTIAVMTGLGAPILIGALGMGIETSYWLELNRSIQNAADSAAIAASTNASTNYGTEAKAVTAQFGFTDGLNNVTVTTSSSATCPSGGNICYSVTVSKVVPLYLTQVVGYSGNATLNGSAATRITATAIAKQGTVARQYCILALGTIGSAILGNGGPNANLAGCNTMSNASSTCNGHNLGADYGDAHLTDNGCGIVQESHIPAAPDPYTGLASNIPSNPCSSYPQEPTHHGDPALPTSNTWSGTQALNGNTIICGDLKLTGDVTINAASGGTLVIENGQLDTNGHTLQTSSGSGLTVVFSGTNSGGYTHAPTGGGTLDIAAPTSGTWSGVALYQDPSLTSGVDIAAAGNSPTWDITGLVYLPHANVTFSGAVNKSSNGQSCFAMVVDSLTINGTGSILDHGACGAAGLSMPTNQVPGRGELVF